MDKEAARIRYLEELYDYSQLNPGLIPSADELLGDKKDGQSTNYWRSIIDGMEHDGLVRAHHTMGSGALKSAADEGPMQKVLASNLHLMAPDQLGFGCRWVKSHPRLAEEFEPDFMVARFDSNGLSWYMVELQSPDTPLLNKRAADKGTDRRSGEASPQLREGIDQIRRWRGWIARKGSEALSATGYPGLNSLAVGIVVIGRSASRTEDDSQRINEIRLENPLVSIRSYDWLAREEAARIKGRGPFTPPEELGCGFDHNSGVFVD
ncbi:hypothetical protein Aab01nite_31620 [Paractinoplanes abujensis]|uniref:Shedu protein SduA C-terminal domain-containing protein n=1 Tax=Paractinoplanes abujensis TaxID=882441 RepID=A0A7W7G704_9ACTN|nr:Shedu anti-phage system protein SduA domain-containing protein [Actinoplanes abujensis]MBB4697945.1 hypothetical protein [Actinoplanes abujensis]GID19572.1 hypothetical protein Aab01nite_31620 [Actinoplanes abujensis]